MLVPSRGAGACQDTAQEITAAAGVPAYGIPGDIASAESAVQLVESALVILGHHIDILVNSAGVNV